MGEAAIRELARTRLGFERLRPGQLRAVAAASQGRDVLAVLPTGGGKSAIYELAGLLRDGPTVVVSPLIALQDDQLAHLRAAGLSAIVLNSQQSARARTAALVASCDSDTFVFVSPEQLANAETREALRRARPGLFVVDEAHLVSQWGHDFRTDYMRLGAQAGALAAPVRMALTATAALPVREEITRRLGLREPEVMIGNFDRPHIELSARGVHSVEEKHRELERAASEFDGAVLGVAPPASLDAYYQELGRAGRDEKDAHARLLFRSEDFGMARHLTSRSIGDGVVFRVAERLAAGRDIEDLGRRQLTAALVRLVDLGAAAWHVDGEVRWTGALSVAEALRASTAETEREDEVEQSRLEMMRRYAEHAGCRRSFLLSYFGQSYRGPCGNCDNDEARVSVAAASEPFAVGGRVTSERWGEGTVQRYDGDQLTVLFDDHGYRDLLVPLVVERGLLRPA